MKNTLADLNNYLFEELERLTDDSLSEEERKKEYERSKAVTHVAQTIVNNAQLALAVMRQAYEQGDKPPVPAMLSGGTDHAAANGNG